MTRQSLQPKPKKAALAPAERSAAGAVFLPAVDIFETEREMTLLADMPGVAPEDIAVTLENGLLTISGTVRPWENAEESDLLVEYEIGRFHRQFALPEAADQGSIEASAADGVLQVTIPRAVGTRSRRISVKTG